MTAAALSRPAAIHCFIGQSIRVYIVLAQGMTNLKVSEFADQLLRFFVELAQFRMLDLVDALHLSDHEFRIADHPERLDAIRIRIAQHSEKSLILGVIVGVVSEIFAEFGDLLTGRILDDHAIAGRPGIAPSAPIDVGCV